MLTHRLTPSGVAGWEPFLIQLDVDETSPRLVKRQVVARATVKTQATSIYRKLDVTSRSEAVERAADIGLIGSAAAAEPRFLPIWQMPPGVGRAAMRT